MKKGIFVSTYFFYRMRFINLLIITCFLGHASLAQTYKKRTPEQKAQYYTELMKKDIDIDSAQASMIYQVNIIVSQRFDSLYASDMEEQARKKAMVPIFKYRDGEYKKILSPKQYLIWDDLEREKREKKKKEKEEKKKAAKDS